MERDWHWPSKIWAPVKSTHKPLLTIPTEGLYADTIKIIVNKGKKIIKYYKKLSYSGGIV